MNCSDFNARFLNISDAYGDVRSACALACTCPTCVEDCANAWATYEHVKLNTGVDGRARYQRGETILLTSLLGGGAILMVLSWAYDAAKNRVRVYR